MRGLRTRRTGSAGEAPPEHRRGRTLPWSDLGLRSRVTVTFGLGALALSATMAGLTYFTARQFILRRARDRHLRQAYVNASLARSSLRSSNPNVTQLLDSLDTVPGSRSVLELKGQWYATSISVGRERHPRWPAQPRALGHPRHPALRARQHPPDGGGSADPQRERLVLRGVLARRLEPDLAHPGPGARRRRPGHHGRRGVDRPLGERPRPASPGAGVAVPRRRSPEAASTPAWSADGDPELSALASSFNQMTDALQERIEHEVRFTSDVSHELRSPLTTLATSLGVLESHRDELPVAQPPRPGPADAELHRFQRMVDDLLEISRVDTGSAELSLDEVEVGELVRQAAAAAVAPGSPSTWTRRSSGVRLRVDKRRIERVVTNLVRQRRAVRRRCHPAGGGARRRRCRAIRGRRPRARGGARRARPDLRALLPGPGRRPAGGDRRHRARALARRRARASARGQGVGGARPRRREPVRRRAPDQGPQRGRIPPPARFRPRSGAQSP